MCCSGRNLQVISQVNAARALFPRTLPDMLIIIRARGDPRTDVLTAPRVIAVTLLFIENSQFTYGNRTQQILFAIDSLHFEAPTSNISNILIYLNSLKYKIVMSK